MQAGTCPVICNNRQSDEILRDCNSHTAVKASIIPQLFSDLLSLVEVLCTYPHSVHNMKYIHTLVQAQGLLSSFESPSTAENSLLRSFMR
jgi:hypothetical protein